mgnify:CR=1 FL=1|jgi:hypothetical protein
MDERVTAFGRSATELEVHQEVGPLQVPPRSAGRGRYIILPRPAGGEPAGTTRAEAPAPATFEDCS